MRAGKERERDSGRREKRMGVPLTNGMIAHCGDIWGTTPIWKMEEEEETKGEEEGRRLLLH